MDGRGEGRGASALLLAAVLLIGINLRGALAAVSPVLPEMRADLGLPNHRGIETVEALLALAALDQGRTPPLVPVDLAELAADVVSDLTALADRAGLTLVTDLGEGDLDGAEPLVRQLVTHLVLNGIRHNTGPGGGVQVTTGTTADGRAALQVVNTGPLVPPHLLATLTEPFVRGVGRLAGPSAGGPDAGPPAAGSGWPSWPGGPVHGATLELSAPPAGGLCVRVVFPEPGV